MTSLEEYDVPGIARKANDTVIVECGKNARHGFKRRSEVIADVTTAHRQGKIAVPTTSRRSST
jgi:hypothetical protein